MGSYGIKSIVKGLSRAKILAIYNEVLEILDNQPVPYEVIEVQEGKECNHDPNKQLKYYLPRPATA